MTLDGHINATMKLYCSNRPLLVPRATPPLPTSFSDALLSICMQFSKFPPLASVMVTF